MDENAIPAPVNPLTLKINLTILRFVRDQFFKKYLPNFAPVITSDLRSAEHNAQVGGASNSAHVHGLAEDFVLTFKAGGPVSETQARAAYDQYIAPNWPGFTEWESSKPGEGYHIHWNLSREVTTYSSLIALAGLGVIGFFIVDSWGKGK
jgi:hypothetical protein